MLIIFINNLKNEWSMRVVEDKLARWVEYSEFRSITW